MGESMMPYPTLSHVPTILPIRMFRPDIQAYYPQAINLDVRFMDQTTLKQISCSVAEVLQLIL